MMTALWMKIAGAAGSLLALVFGFFVIKRSGAKEARLEDRMKDMQNAEDIRSRARDADKRMREFDDAGWRD